MRNVWKNVSKTKKGWYGTRVLNYEILFRMWLWTSVNRLRTGTNCGPLWTWQWFDKQQVISWVAKGQLGTEHELCSTVFAEAHDNNFK